MTDVVLVNTNAFTASLRSTCILATQYKRHLVDLAASWHRARPRP